MAKDPAMLWYWSDWHSGTALMSRFLKGCYIDVLHAQFNFGPLSLEEIKTCLGSDFGQAWPTLQKKFKTCDAGLFFNERLEHEKSKRKNFCDSRRKNKEKKTYDNTYDEHMIEHMENTNENRNTSISKGVVRGILKKPDLSEVLTIIKDVNEAERYLDYYESNGWKVGKNSMKDWKAAARNWIKNKKNYETNLRPLATSAKTAGAQELLAELRAAAGGETGS